MIKYTSPVSEINNSVDTIAASPIPGDNETPIVPWASWISGEG